MKVIHRRDVFDETSMPGIEEHTTKYVQLEIEEEPVVKESNIPKPSDTVCEEIPMDEQLDEESAASDQIISESALCRLTRNKQKPNRYGYSLTAASTEQHDPSSVAEARSSPDKVNWEKAIEREMKSLHSNEIWDLAEPQPDQKVVGSKWIFKRKVDADGAVERYKAQLVAQGCT